MTLPDNLTPHERAQLGKLLAPGRWEAPANEPDEPSLGAPDVEYGDEDESGYGAVGGGGSEAFQDSPPVPIELLDLNTGLAYWRGHTCQLATKDLRKVQRFCVAAIAASTDAELAKLRGEVADAGD